MHEGIMVNLDGNDGHTNLKISSFLIKCVHIFRLVYGVALGKCEFPSPEY